MRGSFARIAAGFVPGSVFIGVWMLSRAWPTYLISELWLMWVICLAASLLLVAKDRLSVGSGLLLGLLALPMYLAQGGL